jgi:hypothetical protein
MANSMIGYWERILDLYDSNLRCRNGSQDQQARSRCERNDCGGERWYCSCVLGVGADRNSARGLPHY